MTGTHRLSSADSHCLFLDCSHSTDPMLAGSELPRSDSPAVREYLPELRAAILWEHGTVRQLSELQPPNGH
jgi:hypothetical protein